MIISDIVLTIITRTHSRTDALLRCIASVDAMMCRNQVQHLFLFDLDSVGTGPSHKFFSYVQDTGLYVLILDDDDLIVEPELVLILLTHIHNGYPDAIFCKMDHGPGLGVLPPTFAAGGFPVQSKVGISTPILSHELFVSVKGSFGLEYDGDFKYVAAAHQHSRRPYYWDHIVTKRGTK